MIGKDLRDRRWRAGKREVGVDIFTTLYILYFSLF
jgi:hypothetical protein